MMRGAHSMLVATFTGLALSTSVIGVAREPLDSGAACHLLQKAIARRDNLPESGPPDVGWFCDIAPSKDPAVYVIALRTSKPRPQGNLIGWYAVVRSSGDVHEWNVSTQRIGVLKVPATGRSGK
jgi:hypothetical protein